MYLNKVDICGIDTSSLTVLKESEKLKLLKEIRADDKNSSAAREKLITGNLRLVLSAVQKFANRKENMDDLFQVGTIGLMKAIDHFDTSLNVRFSTYAVPMIIGEIRRYLRDNNPIRVSRSMRDTAYRAMITREQLQNELSHEPTVEMISKRMDIPREDVVIALESIVDPVSLYDPVYSDSGDTIYVMDQLGDPKSDNDWIQTLSIKDAISNLSEREKKIFALRFFTGKTQTEVAKEIGISQAQVSRLEKAALTRIKSKI